MNLAVSNSGAAGELRPRVSGTNRVCLKATVHLMKEMSQNFFFFFLQPQVLSLWAYIVRIFFIHISQCCLF